MPLKAAGKCWHHEPMRNPARMALCRLLALAASAGLSWIGAGLEAGIGEHWTSLAPLFLGLAAAPLALVILA